MLIVKDLTVSVKWRTAIKALFVYINLCLSVMLYILFTSISSVPSDGALEIRWPTIVEILPFLLHVYSIKMLRHPPMEVIWKCHFWVPCMFNATSLSVFCIIFYLLKKIILLSQIHYILVVSIIEEGNQS
jgi:hypothetical protein